MRKLKELSFNELVICLDSNSTLWDKAYNLFTESQNDYVSELMADWQTSADWFELGSDAYIPELVVSNANYEKFLLGLKESNKKYGFIENQMKLVDRLLEKSTLYKLRVLGYLPGKCFDEFEAWFETGIETICNAICEEIQSYYSTDTSDIANYLSMELSADAYHLGELNKVVVSDDFTAYFPVSEMYL